MRLHSLDPEAKRFVTPELASGTVRRWDAGAQQGLLHPADNPIELDPLDESLDRLIAVHPAFDASLDAAAAPYVHQALPLTRRQASDPGIWRFLTVVHRPDFVRHRWEYRSFSAMRSRFWRHGTRPDSNVFSRLWWIAELTRSGNDYNLTERSLARQPLATNIFVRDLCWYQPAVAASVEALEDAPSPIIESTLQMLNKTLSIIVLETRSKSDLLPLVRTLRQRAEAQG